MKNKYITPAIEIEMAEPEMMICGSQDITSDKGIDYGGVDEEGTLEPASRRHFSVWDEDDEEWFR